LYTVALPETTNAFLYAPTEFTTVGPKLIGGFRDQASQDHAVYISDTHPSILYPARNLIDRYGKVNQRNINLLSEDQLVLTFNDAIPDTYSINPDWLSDAIFPDSLKEQENKLEQEFQSTLYKIDSTLFVSVPIASQQYSVRTEMQQNFDCFHPFTDEKRITLENESVILSSFGGETCGYMVFPNQNLDLGQLIIIKAENIEGIPLRICITENISRKCDVYTALEKDEPSNTHYYVVPPFPTGLDGYVVHFNNVSIGNTRSINKIHSVQVVTLPYYRIQNVKLNLNQQPASTHNNIHLIESSSLNPVTTRFTTSGTGLVVFTKAYDSGWKVYAINSGVLSILLPFVFGTENTTHVEVNSWANGWIIDSAQPNDYILIYLPQYFQYAGILLAGGCLLAIITATAFRSKHS
ncbi:MAG TPA: hypothetical protein PLD54_02435, partial [Candidatus Levybacteria bacterium]|nr:hypothetical protein [Candidatus Levybacteria bacterium]